MVRRHFVLVLLALGAGFSPALGQPYSPAISGLRAEVRPLSFHVKVGQPVWVRFSVDNQTDESITLTVPGTEPEIPLPEVGLPIAHVFSGGSTSGVVVATDAGRRWERPVGYRAQKRAPILMIAAHSSVGITLDLREHFPSLRGAGRFRVLWKPYGGAIESDPVVISVATLKQALVETDQGSMTLRFYYEDAPKTVDNFIELALSGFYDRKLFHRLVPGYLIQGGCPRGDGTGIRLDGKRVPAEFNSRPMTKGTVIMALLEDDPDSASCQFFICNTRQKDWDARYTAFAELVGNESLAVLDRLMATATDESGRPVRPLEIKSIRIVDVPPDDVP